MSRHHASNPAPSETEEPEVTGTETQGEAPESHSETRAERKARLAAEAEASKPVEAIRLARREDDPHARLEGRVNIGDFVVFVTGKGWQLLPENQSVELSRELSRLSIVLAPFSYDPEVGAAYHSVKNLPVAQFYQDATKSQLETNRKDAATALRAALKRSAVPAEEHTAIVVKAVNRIPEPDPEY